MQRGPCKRLITHSRLHSFIHSTAPNIIVTLFGSSEFRFVITVLISTDHPDVFLFSIRHLLAHGKGYNQEFVWESKILVNGVWRPPPPRMIGLSFLATQGKECLWAFPQNGMETGRSWHSLNFISFMHNVRPVSCGSKWHNELSCGPAPSFTLTGMPFLSLMEEN